MSTEQREQTAEDRAETNRLYEERIEEECAQREGRRVG